MLINYSLHNGMLIMNFTIVLISDFSDSLQEIVAVVYCQLLLILGFALPLAEHISLSVSIGKYQFFYVFLYLGSLIYLLFVRIDLFRTGAIDVVTETDASISAKKGKGFNGTENCTSLSDTSNNLENQPRYNNAIVPFGKVRRNNIADHSPTIRNTHVI